MLITLVSLYFKLNIILLFSFLIWLAVRKLARASGMPLNNNKQLKLARYYFIATFVLPIVLVFLNDTLITQSDIPGLSIIGQTLSVNIDNSLSKNISVGSQIFSTSSIVLTLLISGVIAQIISVSYQYMHLKSVLANSIEWKHHHKIWIVFSEDISTPFSTQALGRKQVILPSFLLESPKNLRLAIAHELQHLRNGDLIWVLFMEILRPVFFWNPAFFTWQNEFHCLQEYACDEALLNKKTIDVNSYGNCLLEVSSHVSHKSLLAASNMVPNFGFFRSTNSQLKRRILMLKKKRNYKYTGFKLAAYCCLLMLGLAGCSSAIMNSSGSSQVEGEPYYPIITRAPLYSDTAEEGGLIGWVQIEFDVGESGDTLRPFVVDHCTVISPYDADLKLNAEGCMVDSGIFDEVSIAAIRDFKFNPRFENGKAITTSGVQYLFRFNLDDEGNNDLQNNESSYSEIMDQYIIRGRL